MSFVQQDFWSTYRFVVFRHRPLIHDEFVVGSRDTQCLPQLLPEPYSGMQVIQSRLLQAAVDLKTVFPDERNTYKTDAEVCDTGDALCSKVLPAL